MSVVLYAMAACYVRRRRMDDAANTMKVLLIFGKFAETGNHLQAELRENSEILAARVVLGVLRNKQSRYDDVIRILSEAQQNSASN